MKGMKGMKEMKDEGMGKYPVFSNLESTPKSL